MGRATYTQPTSGCSLDVPAGRDVINADEDSGGKGISWGQARSEPKRNRPTRTTRWSGARDKSTLGPLSERRKSIWRLTFESSATSSSKRHPENRTGSLKSAYKAACVTAPRTNDVYCRR
jgi:hypothetical protein